MDSGIVLTANGRKGAKSETTSERVFPCLLNFAIFRALSRLKSRSFRCETLPHLPRAAGPAMTRFPMIETIDLILPLEASEDEAAWQAAAAKKLGVPVSRVKGLRLLKHSLDARQRAVKVQLRLEVGVDEPLPAEEQPAWSAPALPSQPKTVVIVGCGPAGMFAALRCLELGMKPIVLERGKDASARRFGGVFRNCRRF